MRRVPAALMVVGSVVLGGSSFAACSTVTTTPAPDAAPPPCNPGPFIFCSVARDDEPACNTDDGTSVYLTRLPKSTRYPVGCTVNYVGARDEKGDCPLDAVCKCSTSEAVVPPVVVDAGDAGDGGAAGDAAAPPSGPAHPTWYCAP